MKSEVADVMKLDKEYKLFIGGKWVSASDYGITKEQGLAVAHDVSVECFASFTPVKVTEEAAAKMLGEIFQ
ncbi:hypothetical protein [Methanomethylophilus alvi]|uniref:hypothetical protein n=1 Tax=Methanomethylophilus alvi TaxID=1291540 RepID=UPI0037DC9A09